MLIERSADGAIEIEDHYTRLEDDAPLPAAGAVLVSLGRFQEEREALLARGEGLGVLLRSDESPTVLASDLGALKLIALDFPAFTDGRAYSSARLLRERLGYKGELRAVGDVLCEQLSFMLRSGFDTFEMQSDTALEEWRAVESEVRVVYQPTGDGRATAIDRRQDPDRTERG